MSTRYKAYNREQQYLLPPSLQDWLPEDHLAWFIIDVVDQLDLSGFHEFYSKSLKGQPPFDPAMMVCLLLYAYCIGVPSSRKIEKRTREDVAFRVVAANQKPNFRTISNFRKDHLHLMTDLFLQVLRLCQKAGLVKLGHVALDGSKVKANASKHKAMSYGRMLKREAELEREIWKLFERAEAEDQLEDTKYGADERGWDLPGEVRFRSKRLKTIRKAKRELENEAREAAQKKARDRAEKTKKNHGKEPSGPEPPAPKDAKPKSEAQKNFTDPDSRIMKCSSTKSFEQCYNGQAVVDEAEQVIVAAALTQRADDKGEVGNMLVGMACTLDHIPSGIRFSADAGYFTNQNILDLEEFGFDPYVATGKMKHDEKPLSVRGRPPKDMTVKQRMNRKLRTKKGSKIYSRRKVIDEPVFGQIKEARGLTRFLLRGFEKVSQEWKLWCLTHNILKIFRHGAYTA